MVREILGSMEPKVSWKAEMVSLLMMTKLSSTYLFHIFGGTMELIRANRATHRTTVDLFVSTVVVDEVVV